MPACSPKHSAASASTSDRVRVLRAGVTLASALTFWRPQVDTDWLFWGGARLFPSFLSRWDGEDTFLRSFSTCPGQRQSCRRPCVPASGHACRYHALYLGHKQSHARLVLKPPCSEAVPSPHECELSCSIRDFVIFFRVF